MDLYNIHGDTGGDWRIKKFVDYCTNDINDTIAPLDWWLKQRGTASKSDKLWAALIYSTCYCLGTTCFVFSHLDYRTATLETVQKFWAKYKDNLIFQSDRRYVKNMNWFVPIVGDFLERTKGNPKYFKKLLTGTPEEVYKNMYKEVNSWRYYGRFSTILFLKTLLYLLPVEMDFKLDYDWMNGETTTAGALVLKYRDNAAKKFLEGDKSIVKKHKPYFDSLMLELKEKWLPWDNSLHITSAFCSYFKLYKQTRYIGYYVDRGQMELLKLQTTLPKSPIWEELWRARKETIDHKYLGEIQGWSSIRNSKFKDFTETGLLYE